jgi:hypothetical protein
VFYFNVCVTVISVSPRALELCGVVHQQEAGKSLYRDPNEPLSCRPYLHAGIP